jgi:hypothetical protein
VPRDQLVGLTAQRIALDLLASWSLTCRRRPRASRGVELTGVLSDVMQRYNDGNECCGTAPARPVLSRRPARECRSSSNRG